MPPTCSWIIRFAHSAGLPVGLQRATRFCPACIGMTCFWLKVSAIRVRSLFDWLA